jgi:hypothetical protein
MLAVWLADDGDRHWLVADSLDQAKEMYEEYIAFVEEDWDSVNFTELPPDQTIEFDIGERKVEKTCEQWIQHMRDTPHGVEVPGLLASTLTD